MMPKDAPVILFGPGVIIEEKRKIDKGRKSIFEIIIFERTSIQKNRFFSHKGEFTESVKLTETSNFTAEYNQACSPPQENTPFYLPDKSKKTCPGADQGWQRRTGPGLF